MILKVLGSGSCIVAQERTSSGYILQANDSILMIDTGTGTTDALRRAGINTDDIDAVVNTHRHPDHISDLVPIIQDKIVRSFQDEEPEIKLLGPEGHIDYLESRIFHEMKEDIHEFDDLFDFQVSIAELEQVSEVKDIDIQVFDADHGPEGFKCVSLKFEAEKTIFFTGDTDFFEGLAENAAGADMIVADCSKPDEEKVEGHMTPTECGKLAQGADADKLVLSHLYPEAEASDIRDSAQEHFEGDILVAEDLKEFEV